MAISPTRPTAETDDDAALTVPEFARLLNVQGETVRDWIRRGHLKAIKLPGSAFAHWRIPRSELDRIREG